MNLIFVLGIVLIAAALMLFGILFHNAGVGWNIEFLQWIGAFFQVVGIGVLLAQGIMLIL
jgi:hypothetical protein